MVFRIYCQNYILIFHSRFVCSDECNLANCAWILTEFLPLCVVDLPSISNSTFRNSILCLLYSSSTVMFDLFKYFLSSLISRSIPLTYSGLAIDIFQHRFSLLLRCHFSTVWVRFRIAFDRYSTISPKSSQCLPLLPTRIQIPKFYTADNYRRIIQQENQPTYQQVLPCS